MASRVWLGSSFPLPKQLLGSSWVVLSFSQSMVLATSKDVYAHINAVSKKNRYMYACTHIIQVQYNIVQSQLVYMFLHHHVIIV